MPVRVYGNFGDFAALGAYDGILSGLKKIGQAVIPKHTIVGKAISGDIGGAARDAGRYAQGFIGSGGGSGATAVPVPSSGSASMTSSLPSWVMPVAIGGGALLLLIMLRPPSRR